MFEHFPQTQIEIVGPNGVLRHRTKALVDSKSIVVPDPSLTVLVGDEIRRMLPNGSIETFEVQDPVYFDEFEGIPAHYQIKVRRKGMSATRTSDRFQFSISGQNARINFGTDRSKNIIRNGAGFTELIDALSHIDDEKERLNLESIAKELQASQDDKQIFLGVYQKFVAAAANHMTIIAPFLPALSQMLA